MLYYKSTRGATAKAGALFFYAKNHALGQFRLYVRIGRINGIGRKSGV